MSRIAWRLIILVTLPLLLFTFQGRRQVAADPPPNPYRPAPNVHISPPRNVVAQIRAAAGPFAPSATANMTYHGGPVEHTVKVFTIFWTPNGTIDLGFQTLVNRYFQDINASGFYNINTQYFDNPGAVPMQNVSVLGGTWVDTSNPYPHAGTAGDPLLNADIVAEVDRALAINPSWGPPGTDRMYFVYQEQGIESCFNASSCTPGITGGAVTGNYCAYHSVSGGKVFANMPYVETWGGSCRGFSVSPNGHLAADAEISTSSHEHFEAATDPHLDAWYDDTLSGENGDKCAYIYSSADATNAKGTVQPGGHNLVMNGHPYIIQLEWSNADLDPTKASSGCVSRFAASVDVGITKSDTPDTVNAGDLLTYSISVQNNNATFEATDLALSDVLPASTIFKSISAPPGWACTTPPIDQTGTVTCKTLSLPKATTADFTLVVGVKPTTTPGTISNTATISSSSGDTNATNDSATATTTVNSQADLSVSKSDSPDPVLAGNQLTYTVTVSNSGPGGASGVSLTDTLPSGLVYVSDSAGCSLAASTLTCALSTIAAGASKSVTIVMKVPAGYLSGIPASTATISNTASVTTTSTDPNAGNNSVTIQTTVNEQADLRITKECKPDQPNKQPAGTPTFCEIYVDNTGPSDAQGVIITDRIISSTPVTITGVVASSTSGPAPTCAPATPIGPISDVTITCNDTILPAGARDTIRVTFVANQTGDVNDTASVSSGTPDPNPSNNSATGRVSFANSADLAVTKTDSPDPVTGGTNLTYTISVSNAGPSVAPNVVLTDVLSGQTTFVSATPSQGSCLSGVVPGDPTKPLTCNLGSLASGPPASVVVVVKVKPSVPAGTVIVNNADIKSDAADPNTGNNVVTATTTVATSANLAITKTADAAAYKPNSVVTYHVTVSNAVGPSDAQNVVVTDVLPDQKQAIYQSDTGGCVFQAPKTLTCNIGTLAAGAGKDFFIYVLIKGAQGDVTNQASVASTTTDPVVANNSSTVVVSVQGGVKP